MSTQCLFLLVRSFIDPTFCGIFVCGPLQFKCPFLSAEPLASAVDPRSSQVSFLAGVAGVGEHCVTPAGAAAKETGTSSKR